MPTEKREFFTARRKVELEDWRPLLSETNEKRIRLDLLMPLTGEGILGIPDWVAPSYERMDVEGSPVKEIDLAAEIEGMTLEAFSTDQAQFPIETEAHGLTVSSDELGRRHVLLPASTLRAFKLVRVTRDKQALVCLQFSLTAKTDAALVLWAYKYHGASFWAQFTPSDDANLGTPKSRADQMTLAQQANKEALKKYEKPAEQKPEEAQKNAEKFFGSEPNVPKQSAEAKAAVDAMPATTTRRPRGFGGSPARPGVV